MPCIIIAQTTERVYTLPRKSCVKKVALSGQKGTASTVPPLLRLAQASVCLVFLLFLRFSNDLFGHMSWHWVIMREFHSEDTAPLGH